MACWLYEGLLLFGVVFIAGYLFGTLSQTRHALDNRHALQGFLFIVFGIYFTWFLGQGPYFGHENLAYPRGRCPRPSPHPNPRPAALCPQLALVFTAFTRCSTLGLSAAEITVLLFGWVAVWAILSRFHPLGQFWHDALAGTRLVHFVHTRTPQKP